MLETALAQPQVSEDGWVELLPAATYHTDAYGAVPITQEKLDRMVKNFNDNIRGQDIAINYDHGTDRAKGNKAAGWYKEVAIKPSSKDPTIPALHGRIDFTDEAKSEIASGEWKYFSLEWDDQWINVMNGDPVADVIVGGAITNRPIAKGLKALPINFSEAMWVEVDPDTRKEFAVWTSKYVDSLPDSSFLHIDSNGRHLPYKDASGKIDLPHLRNAIARIPQVKGIDDNKKASLQSRARAMLSKMSKAYSEPALMEAVETLAEAGIDVFDSSPDWGAADPGTNAPLIDGGSSNQPDPGTKEFVPRENADPGKEDPAIGSGSRRHNDVPLEPDAPGAPDPNAKGGENVVDENELQKLFDEIMKHLKEADQPAVTNMFSEAIKAGEPEVAKKLALVFSEYGALKANEYTSDEEKRFAEQFPRLWRERVADRESARERNAKEFSESVEIITRTQGDKQVATKMGLSGLALEKVAEAHKQFSELGNPEALAAFEAAVSTITKGGLVEFGETGSSRGSDVAGPEFDTNSLEGLSKAKHAFSELVTQIRSEEGNDKMSFAEGMAAAAKARPDLYEAYTRTPVAG